MRGGLATFAALVAGRRLTACVTSEARSGGPVSDDDAFVVLPDARGVEDATMTLDANASMPFVPNPMPAAPQLRSRLGEIGPLGPANADGVRVPAGFTARVVARAGEPVGDTGLVWHRFPDGGACFATMDGGWIYVSNSEVPIVGGVSAIRFDSDGAIVEARRILDRTNTNCAGGWTPWGSWLSCEEVPRGLVYECDPWGRQAPQPRAALGVFKHEAVAVDPERGHLYLTEDERDGCFYRFTPASRTPMGHPDLRAGRLEVASVDSEGHVRWELVPDPAFAMGVPTRMQVPSASRFNGGEGIWWHDDVVYFTTKGDHKVHAYRCVDAHLRVLYDANRAADPILRGVDNLTVTCCGDVVVAEDGDDMQLVAILPDGSLRVLAQVEGQDHSEITGPAFDPSGTRLYFSSQRGGPSGGGITYVVEGPFHEPV